MRYLIAVIVLTGVISCKKRIETIQGPRGDQGSIGISGTHGMSVVFDMIPSEVSNCSNGGATYLIGYDSNSNNVLDTGDTNITSSTICNGTNGQDVAPSPFSPTSVLDPCGDAPGKLDEVLLKLHNGMVLASVSDNTNGKNTRFSIISAGTYKTTDGDNCTFTLDSYGDIIYESHSY